MAWVLGALALLLIGSVLRRILRLDTKMARRPTILAPLDPPREALYQPLALEVETQSAILGISLNDAFEERDSGHHEIAWRLVQLSLGEWDRLMELITALLKVVAQYLPTARRAVPLRGIVAKRFRSRTMADSVRMHELLDQLVVGSGLRFQLHLRFLRRAAETLTAQFHRDYRYAERTEDRPEELWNWLDLCFHDIDLIAKEALLTFRALLVSLPDSALENIGTDVKSVVERGVRSTPSTVE